MRLLPEDLAVSSVTYSRHRADKETSAAITVMLSTLPEGWSVICAVCARLRRTGPPPEFECRKDTTFVLTPNPDAISYHLLAKYVEPPSDEYTYDGF